MFLFGRAEKKDNTLGAYIERSIRDRVCEHMALFTYVLRVYLHHATEN